MAKFFIKLDGVDGEGIEADFPSIEEARNATVAHLGGYLQQHPNFAVQRHWRVDLLDHAKRLLLHVIVATVDAPKPINWASYEN